MTKQKNNKKEYVACVVVAYDYADKKKGDIISRHYSYAAAERACNNSHLRVSYVSDLKR